MSIRRPKTIGGRVNPTEERSCYDEGKRGAETLFFDYHRQHKLRIKVARTFNTYGPRMHPNDGRVVSNFIVQALCGEPITLYGDGMQTRSFCLVDDMIEGLFRTMESADEVSRPIDLGNPNEISMRTLAETIVRLTGSRSELVNRPLPQDDPTQRCPDIGPARRLLDWQPQVALEEGLRETIRYFQRSLRFSARRRSETGAGQAMHS